MWCGSRSPACPGSFFRFRARKKAVKVTWSGRGPPRLGYLPLIGTEPDEGSKVKKITIAAISVAAFVFVGTAGAALVPGVFDPDKTGCPVAAAQNGWLHLEKNCVSSTNASAFGQITGV